MVVHLLIFLTYNMRQFILDFPNQFKKGIKAAEAADLNSLTARKNDFQNLIICGMGGSALPGELIKILPHLNIPVFIHKSYGLPKEAGDESFVFISSYSGDTEETVSALNEAIQRKLNIIAFSKGGILEKICFENNIAYVKYSEENKNFQPRFALGHSFSAMMLMLFRFGFLPHDPKLKLNELAENLIVQNKFLEEQGKETAEKIFGKIILIYAPYNLRTLSYIWKINFNETSKIPAFSNCFSELNHNEINGFVNISKIAKDKIKILNLLDENADKRIVRQSQITAGLLFKEGIETINIPLQGSNILQKIFSSVLLSMWTSYYLALLYNTDPIQVKMVEDLKKELAK